jgi:hypothetical protein
MSRRVKRSRNEMVSMSRARILSRVSMIAALVCAVGLGACATMEPKAGPLPEWAQERSVELAGTGYPDLRDVPQTPTGLPELPEWIERRDQLGTLNARMAASACAVVPETDAANWARATGGPIAADPRGEIPAGEDPAIWARRQLAKLPPVAPQTIPKGASVAGAASATPASPQVSAPASVTNPAAAPSPDTSNDPRILQNQTSTPLCL